MIKHKVFLPTGKLMMPILLRNVLIMIINTGKVLDLSGIKMIIEIPRKRSENIFLFLKHFIFK